MVQYFIFYEFSDDDTRKIYLDEAQIISFYWIARLGPTGNLLHSNNIF